MRALLPVLVVGCAAAAGDTKLKSDEAPLVIELFTSQGCSSCPPADALLDKLARAGQLGGRTLAPLSFHVDYWDDLGWADPFASAAWTERQRDYAQALGDKRVYTPALVVGGRVAMVGSHGTRVAQAIADAPRQQKLVASGTWSTDALAIEVTAPTNADVWLAIWQDGTKTRIPRGENAGETLAADRVVRKLELVATAGKQVSKKIALDTKWQAGGAVLFAQQADRAIVASALLPRAR